PDAYISQLQEDHYISIRYNLGVLEKIKIPKEWGNVKFFRHRDFPLYQLSVKSHRLYLHLNTTKKTIVVCYACKKKGQKAKAKDLDRAIAQIQLYCRENEG
ncbi:MAG: hypothetical protein KJ638_02995, partial [Chloroflexi bacterium]|nr:hypothetical protein [Chloroflexota bacterium]